MVPRKLPPTSKKLRFTDTVLGYLKENPPQYDERLDLFFGSLMLGTTGGTFGTVTPLVDSKQDYTCVSQSRDWVFQRSNGLLCVCVYPGNAVLDIHIKAWYAARYTANLLLHLWDCGAYETATALQLSRLLQLSSHGSPAFTPRKEKEGRFCES